jgi:hypothetical protein
VLPSDVLNSLLASLDPQSLLNICTTNKAFSAFCSSKLGRKALDQASIQYIAQEAPLSKPIRSLGEQASLIKRGFATVYNVDYIIEKGVFIAASFYDEGMQAFFGYREEAEGYFHFEIKGCPPAEGTRVWIVIFVYHDYDYHRDETITTVRCDGVYVTMEDAWSQHGYDKTMMVPHKDNPRGRLLENGKNQFIFQVVLP